MRQNCMSENSLFEICANFNIKMELRILFIFRIFSIFTRDLATIEWGSDKIVLCIECWNGQEYYIYYSPYRTLERLWVILTKLKTNKTIQKMSFLEKNINDKMLNVDMVKKGYLEQGYTQENFPTKLL